MVATWSGSLEPITAESTAARIPYTTQPPTFYLSTHYDSSQDLPSTTSGTTSGAYLFIQSYESIWLVAFSFQEELNDNHVYFQIVCKHILSKLLDKICYWFKI